MESDVMVSSKQVWWETAPSLPSSFPLWAPSGSMFSMWPAWHDVSQKSLAALYPFGLCSVSKVEHPQLLLSESSERHWHPKAYFCCFPPEWIRNGSINESKGYNSGLAGFKPHGNHKNLCQEGVIALHSNTRSVSPVESQHCPAHLVPVLGQREDALQGNPPVQLAEEEGGNVFRSCCSLRAKVVPLPSLAGFVCTAIASLTITFSPTWSCFSSCSAASPWQLRTPWDTSPLGTKYAPHPPSLTGDCKCGTSWSWFEARKSRRGCIRGLECLPSMISAFCRLCVKIIRFFCRKHESVQNLASGSLQKCV